MGSVNTLKDLVVGLLHDNDITDDNIFFVDEGGNGHIIVELDGDSFRVDDVDDDKTEIDEYNDNDQMYLEPFEASLRDAGLKFSFADDEGVYEYDIWDGQKQIQISIHRGLTLIFRGAIIYSQSRGRISLMEQGHKYYVVVWHTEKVRINGAYINEPHDH